MYHLRLLQNFLKVNKSQRLKKCGRNDFVYILINQYKLAHLVGSRYHHSAKLVSNKLSNYYSNAYEKHWNNSGSICFLNVILLTRDIILYTRLTEFHMFILTQLKCLHNFQVDILSYKEAILQRCTLKELRSKLATMLKMCCYRYFSKSLENFL